MPARISELFPNPPGTDRGKEWIELCATESGTSLGDYALAIGTRRIMLSGVLDAGTCRIARTGSTALRNTAPETSLLYIGAEAQRVASAGVAPENAAWHVVGASGFWATSTPGLPSEAAPALPEPPPLQASSSLPGLLGTAACTAGILTALTLATLRHARNRHNARLRRDPPARL